MIEINLNDAVYVQLTPHGKEVLEGSHNKFYAHIKALTGNEIPKYNPPKEDAGGWSKWQLWTLMEALGFSCKNGFNVPFKTGIRFDEGKIVGGMP